MATIHRIGNSRAAQAVIFLHGVNGSWDTTWCRADGRFSWPHELARATGWDVRVVDYDVNTSWGRTTMPLQDRAVNLVTTIESDPDLTKKDLALICHSFGGLVAKQVVRYAVEDEQADFLRRLAALVFVATPHQGDLKADFLVYLKHLLGSTVTLEDLRAHSPLLRDLGHWYRTQHERLGLRTLVFFEKQRMKLGWLRTLQVVNDDSGNPGIPGVRPIPVDADHAAIAKPTAAADVQFARTLQFLTDVFSLPAALGKLPPQFAGVPYRDGPDGIEFLLVRTSGHRWTFPKGGRKREDVEEWQAAERETDEESGVSGDIDREPFTVYRHAKRELKDETIMEFAVRAFLLRVTRERDDFPERTSRGRPAWFTPQAAKQALAEDRPARYAKELAEVVDRALARIAGAPAARSGGGVTSPSS